MQLHGTFAWSPPALARKTRWRDGIDCCIQQLGIMHVGARDRHRQWEAMPVDHQMPLGAQLAAIRRILAGCFAAGRGRDTRAVEGGPLSVDPPRILQAV
jgi:hypothetical protein